MENSIQSKAWIETPLILSKHLTALLGRKVYLKLENLQPSQSFKYRGISLFAEECKQEHGASAHLIIASSGNAGYAAACAAKELGLKCTVYLHEGVSNSTMDLLRKAGANVVVVGTYYIEAFHGAQEAVANDANAVLVPPYDHPTLWRGHASIIEEISRQLPSRPDAIFCSVGGGGLLGGVLVGCKDVGWDDVPVIALETHGSACFYESMEANKGERFTEGDGVEVVFDTTYNVQVAHLAKLTSKAASLGASSAAAGVVKMALEHGGGVTSMTVPDELSMRACSLFADDHKCLVELACATTLGPVYTPSLFSRLCDELRAKRGPCTTIESIVVVICGGVKISVDDLKEYEALVSPLLNDKDYTWHIRCNGQAWRIRQ